MLDVDVFKHGFNNHVGLFEAGVIQLPGQVGQGAVALEGCDAPLFSLVIEPCIEEALLLKCCLNT